MSKAQNPGTLASQRAALVILPGILTTHFMLTLLLTLVGTLIPGDRLFLVCYNDDVMMWAFKLKEDQHLSIPPSPSLSLSLSVSLSSRFLPLNLRFDLFTSLHLSLSACVSSFCLCFPRLISPFLIGLNIKFSFSLCLFLSLLCPPPPPLPTFPSSQTLP